MADCACGMTAVCRECGSYEAVFRAGQIEALRNVAIGLAFEVDWYGRSGVFPLELREAVRLRYVTIEALAKLGDASARRMVTK